MKCQIQNFTLLYSVRRGNIPQVWYDSKYETSEKHWYALTKNRYVLKVAMTFCTGGRSAFYCWANIELPAGEAQAFTTFIITLLLCL